MNLRETVIDKLKNIYDPEIPVDIYNLGLIYDVSFEECSKGYYCNILMTFTSPNCPVADFLVDCVDRSVSKIEEVFKVEIKITFDPPWDRSKISDEGRELFEMENVM
ncbi:MAG: iron-sulfur cluster assembly protein [Spirochaetaceae bacterium]